MGSGVLESMQKNVRKRVLIDVDGVCADFLSAAIRTFESVSGQTWKPEDFHGSWSLEDRVGDEIWRLAVSKFREPGWCLGLAPYPEALVGVREVMQAADVFFVTAPFDSPTWAWEREQWLKEHFNIHHKQVVSTAAKHIVEGDMLIDDKPSNVYQWKDSYKDGMAVLWDHPTNRHIEGETVLRIRDWNEILRLVNQ